MIKSLPSESRSPTGLALILALAIVFATAVWSTASGFVAANDDVKWVRMPSHDLGLWGALHHAWSTEASFRPLEVVVGSLCDPVSLDCRAAIPVQAAGLALFLLGAILAARRAMPGHPWAMPIVVALLGISPAVTCSVWQMDTCSQTWSGALGLWGALVACRVITAAGQATIDLAGLAWLLLIFAVGVNIKETFYGWSAGIGLAVLLSLVPLWKRGRRAVIVGALATLPTIVLPILHLGLRFQFGALGQRLGDDPEARYQVQMGSNVVINAAMSLGAIFGCGPFHLVEDDGASVWMRLLPFVTLLASGSVLLAAALLAWMHRRRPEGIALPKLAFLSGASILSLLVVLPMSSVSELYGMGANAGSLLAITAAAIFLWRLPPVGERAFGRGLVLFLAVTSSVVGTYGVITRAMHNRVTWACASAVNRQMLEHQRGLPPTPPGGRPEIAHVYFDPNCRQVRTYSQYVIPPIQAINIWSTGEWMNRRYPDRPVEIRVTSPPWRPLPRDLVIDCASMPDHGHW
jgi:hypothetical protein